MAIKLKNNSYSTIANTITDSDTTIIVATGEGIRFPSLGVDEYFYATLQNNSNIEIVKVVARSGDSMTVVRGQDNTTALSFPAGSKFEMRWNVKQVEDKISSDLSSYVKNNETSAISTNTPEFDGTSGKIIKDSGYSLKTIQSISKDTTGFTNNKNISITYDSVNRTVTLTGTFEAYWRGNKIAALTNGWTSPAHNTGNGAFFLYYDGSNFVWSSTPWNFEVLQIAFIFRGNANLCIREVHGFMDSETHKEFHEKDGTYLVSGGDLSNYVLNSTTATNRRPYISQTTIADEDLESVLPALNTNAYSWFFLSSTNTANISNDNTEIISVTGSTPNYNLFNGSIWTQSAFPNNAYGKIYVMAVPVSNDTTCQKSRYIFIQPQTVSTTLATIRSLLPSSVNLGELTSALSEYVFIAEIIVRFTAGNWSITEVNKLTGSRSFQLTNPAGAYLSAVTSNNAQFIGNGTTSDPLTLSGIIYPQTDSTSSVQVRKSDNATVVLNVDTENIRVGISNFAPTEMLEIGSNSTSSTNRKAIRLASGGFANPGSYNTNSNGDKIILYHDTTNGYDGRIGVGANENIWIKSSGTTTTSGVITFHTGSNANERVRISGEGRLGVGFSDPQTNLESISAIRSTSINNFGSMQSVRVNGSRTSPTAILNNDIIGEFIFGGTYGTSLTEITAGARIRGIASSNWSGISNCATDIAFLTASTTSSPVERMRITNSGLVGISNQNPAELLEVGANTSNNSDRKAIRIGSGGFSAPAGYNTNSDGDKIILYHNTTNGYDGRIGVGSEANIWFKSSGTSSTTGAFTFHTGSSATERLRITGDGRLSIGFSDPQTNLECLNHIRVTSTGTASSLQAMRLNNTRASPTAINMNDTIGEVSFCGLYGNNISSVAHGAKIVALASAAWTGLTSCPTDLTFLTAVAGSAATERMRISNSGNVGINTTSPTEATLTILRNGGNGVTIKSADSNASVLNFGVHTTNGYTYIHSNATGSGTVRPLTFWVGESETARITSSGFFGLGTTNPISEFTIASSSTSLTRGITTMQNNSGIHGAYYNFYKSRGTVSSPTSIVANDFIGSFVAHGYISSYVRGAAIDFFCPAVGTNNVAVDIIFRTGTTTSNDTERFRITNNGNVRIVPTTYGSNGALVFMDTGNTYPRWNIYPFTTDGGTYGSLNFSTGDGTDRFIITNSGSLLVNSLGLRSIGIYNNTSGSSANVGVGADGQLYRSTSSIKFKTNIEDLEDKYSENIYKMRPVWYRSLCKTDRKDWSFFGLIAEELAEIEPRLVTWGYFEEDYENGKLKEGVEEKPVGVQYERLTVLLLAEIQKLNKKIKDLEDKING